MKSIKNPPLIPSCHQPGALQLEALERRLLLSAVLTGIETDGDEYEIRILGAGAILDGSLENLTVSGTNMNSILQVTVKTPVADGLLEVGQVDTGGSNLGRLWVQGDLGALMVGRISRIKVDTLGAAAEASHLFNIAGDAGDILVPGGVSDAAVTVSGSLRKLQVGRPYDGSSNISNSSFSVWGNLDYIRLRQSLTADSTISVHGDVLKIDIDKSVTSSAIDVDGNVEKIIVDGGIRNNCSISVAGDVFFFKAVKTVSDTNINIDGTLTLGKFRTDIQNSTLLCDAVDQLLVKDDLNDTQIGIAGDLNYLKANDSQGLTLRVGGTLNRAKIVRDLDEALLAVLDGIGSVKVGQDLYRSTIVGGIDIGADFTLDPAPGGDDIEWGNIEIKKVKIGGDMIDSSIAAGVSPRGPFFGDGDDEPAADNTGTARIHRIIVKGDISSTNLPGESYAITAGDLIDLVRSNRLPFNGTAGVVLQLF
ncbi:MAG: hypothetical protein AMJ79_13665 [Phycisphaerae bacterium SM23_30]|nr:MAG: hypothetical protein AMJ79_13665 [Phycisphaerae bacterium SM23_30]